MTKSSIRRVTSSVSPARRGMIRPMTKAPKIAATPICWATKAERRTPTKITPSQIAGTRPTSSKAVASRPRKRRPMVSIAATKTPVQPTITSASIPEPVPATAVASASRPHAVTSSIAAPAIESAPTGRFSIRFSMRMRASTGNAVTDIETPMKRANGR